MIFAIRVGHSGRSARSGCNIELVKSLGLAQQEIGRLNATTTKILKLELKKVRYLRSLSFIQGTFVNLLRTSIQFLMMYLIFAHRLSIGDYMALFIYSFFIFGPLQELGNVVNTYREAEVSLQKFEAILAMKPEPRPANPVSVRELDTLEFRDVGPAQQRLTTRAAAHFLQRDARADNRIPRRPIRRQRNHAPVKLLVGLYRPKNRPYSLQRSSGRRNRHRRSARAHRLRHAGDAQLFSGSIRENLHLRAARRHRRGVPGRAPPGFRANTFGARRPRPRHCHRRRRREGFGRRETAPLHCPRAAPQTPAPGFRRSNFIAGFADGRRNQSHNPQRGRDKTTLSQF